MKGGRIWRGLEEWKGKLLAKISEKGRTGFSGPKINDKYPVKNNSLSTALGVRVIPLQHSLTSKKANR